MAPSSELAALNLFLVVPLKYITVPLQFTTCTVVRNSTFSIHYCTFIHIYVHIFADILGRKQFSSLTYICTHIYYGECINSLIRNFLPLDLLSPTFRSSFFACVPYLIILPSKKHSYTHNYVSTFLS